MIFRSIKDLEIIGGIEADKKGLGFSDIIDASANLINARKPKETDATWSQIIATSSQQDLTPTDEISSLFYQDRRV